MARKSVSVKEIIKSAFVSYRNYARYRGAGICAQSERLSASYILCAGDAWERYMSFRSLLLAGIPTDSWDEFTDRFEECLSDGNLEGALEVYFSY